jgi:iron complex transport system substrate-binding protein
MAGEQLRVVALVPSLAEIVVALGGSEHLVARTDYDTHPAIVGLPSIGGGLDPSVEALVGLGVEVVLMAGGRDTPALGEQLQALGIQAIPFSTETVADIHASSQRLGALLGLQAEADSLSQAIQAGLGAVRQSVEGRPRVSAMYVVWSDPPMTAGPNTFIDDLIDIAGGRNAFGDIELPWPTVGFESIVDRAPDVILWPQGEITVDNVDQLTQTPGWRDVPAVQAGRVALVDANLFNRPGPGVVEAARTLANILHPDLR